MSLGCCPRSMVLGIQGVLESSAAVIVLGWSPAGVGVGLGSGLGTLGPWSGSMVSSIERVYSYSNG